MTEQYITAQPSPAQPSPAQPSPAQPCPAQPSEQHAVLLPQQCWDCHGLGHSIWIKSADFGAGQAHSMLGANSPANTASSPDSTTLSPANPAHGSPTQPSPSPPSTSPSLPTTSDCPTGKSHAQCLPYSKGPRAMLIWYQSWHAL